ncbi:hypothetical protein AWV80_31455 [Cupriavidus sp. UYMU48A]|nr:hypothetical protein AWV80_31455 [Cupriavidus sp. UYMU48A]
MESPDGQEGGWNVVGADGRGRAGYLVTTGKTTADRAVSGRIVFDYDAPARFGSLPELPRQSPRATQPFTGLRQARRACGDPTPAQTGPGGAWASNQTFLRGYSVESEPLSAGKVAAAFRVSTPTAAVVLKGMVEAGQVMEGPAQWAASAATRRPRQPGAD